MFKIEYDMVIGGHLHTFTHDRVFLTMYAASHEARHIRNAKHADVYVIDTANGQVVDYWWAD